MRGSLRDSLSLAPLFCLALFACLAHGFVLAKSSVPTWIWVPALAGGIALARASVANQPSSTSDRRPTSRMERGLVVALLGATFVALAYGALATPSREWDGFVSWELRARVLATNPSLEQDFFRDGAVFAHTREYPPLQPLVLASLAQLSGSLAAARLFFPLLWLAWLALLSRGFRAAGLPTRWHDLGLCAAGLTPVLVDPTMGAVDSGFGEMLCLFGWTGAALGLATRSGPTTAAALALTLLAKPEGLLLSGIFVFVAWLRAPLTVLLGALLGAGTAAVLWLPVYSGLSGGTPVSPWALAGAALAAGAAMVGSAAWLARRSPRPWLRLAVGAGAIALLVTLGALFSTTVDGQGGVLGLYLGGATRALARLDRLAEILAAILSTALAPRHLGFLVWLGLALAILAPRRCPNTNMLWLVGAGFAGLIVPFLLSPETDLRHHVSSSLDRLLLQQSGAAWLLVLPWLHQATRDPAQPAGLVAGSTK